MEKPGKTLKGFLRCIKDYTLPSFLYQVKIGLNANSAKNASKKHAQLVRIFFQMHLQTTLSQLCAWFLNELRGVVKVARMGKMLVITFAYMHLSKLFHSKSR